MLAQKAKYRLRALVELARGQGARASAGARDATADVLEAYTVAAQPEPTPRTRSTRPSPDSR